MQSIQDSLYTDSFCRQMLGSCVWTSPSLRDPRLGVAMHTCHLIWQAKGELWVWCQPEPFGETLLSKQITKGLQRCFFMTSGLGSSTYMAARMHLHLEFQEKWCPLLTSSVSRHIHAGKKKNTHMHKIKTNNFVCLERCLSSYKLLFFQRIRVYLPVCGAKTIRALLCLMVKRRGKTRKGGHRVKEIRGRTMLSV